MNNKDIQLSKLLCWLLRHGAVKEGYNLSPEGYLDIDKILQHRLFRGKYTQSDILKIVKENDKQRFKLRHNPQTSQLQIKAHQGHTISEISLELTPILQVNNYFREMENRDISTSAPRVFINRQYTNKRRQNKVPFVQKNNSVLNQNMQGKVNPLSKTQTVSSHSTPCASIPPVTNHTPGPSMAQVPLPSTSQVPLPSTSQVPLPSTAQVHLPSTAQAPRPSTAQVPRPSTAQVPLPSKAQAPLPSTAQAPRPSTAQVPRPSTAQVPLPSKAQAPLPSTAQAPLPSTAQVSIPSKDQAPLPSTAQVPLPSTAQVPLSATAQVPLPSTAQVPLSSTAQVPRPSTAQAPRPSKPQAPRTIISNKGSNGRYNIEVTGFSSDVTQVDLGVMFCKFGWVRIEHFDNHTSPRAVLSYRNRKEADAAVKKNRKLNLKGNFLNVINLNVSEDTIDQDETVDLSDSHLWTGSFDEQVAKILAKLRMTREEVFNLHNLYDDIEMALRNKWPGCLVIPFGSVTTGMGTKFSDADCFVKLPNEYGPCRNDVLVLESKKLFQRHPLIFSNVISIPQASVPIVKLQHKPTKTKCDVTFKNMLGVKNSQLISFLLHLQPELIKVAIIIKQWAKLNEFSGTGKFTNYALILMLIFCLQKHCNFPFIKDLQADPENEEIIDGWNSGFNSNFKWQDIYSYSAIDMLHKFFSFYGNCFDYDTYIVSPYKGINIEKHHFGNKDKLRELGYERYLENVENGHCLPLLTEKVICVQDPFEHCRNVTAMVTPIMATRMRECCRAAALYFEKGKAVKWKKYLYELIGKKTIISIKYIHSTFHASICSETLFKIAAIDWELIMRRVVLLAFEQVLKIKLKKNRNKDKSNIYKFEETYKAHMRKPIWLRNHSKEAPDTSTCLQERETRITEDLIKMFDKEINVHFNLVVTYSYQPRIVVIRLNNMSQDMKSINDFKAFGNFYVNSAHSWISEFLKPYFKENVLTERMRNMSFDASSVSGSELYYYDSDASSMYN